MLRALRLALALLLALAAGCAGDQTAILVEVSSPDLSVPEDVDTLRFEATSEFGSRIDRSFPIEGQWPHSLTIVPPEDERMGALTITVTAQRDGAFVVRRVVGTAFESGHTRRIAVALGADCVGMICPDGVDCAAGRCVGIEPPHAGADTSVPDAGSDAGPLDAGALDAGLDTGIGDAGIEDPGIEDAGPGPITLLINEIDYDIAGGDNAEFVELLNAGAAPVDLSNLHLVLLNGSSQPASPYSTTLLSGMLGAGERVVLCAVRWVDGGPPEPVVSLPDGVRAIPIADLDGIDVIQNGPGDAVVIWNNSTMQAIDALLYEGSSDGAMGAVGLATFPLVSGTRTTIEDSNTVTMAFCRNPDGADSGSDAADWSLCATPSPGAANVP